MARPEPLLAGILASPDALGPRRVFADALQERSDPRGEFIALQCIEQPDETQRKRAMALLRLHWQEWTGGLTPLADFRTVRFVRGFLHSVSLRRSPHWLQASVVPSPEHGLLRHVEVVRDFVPEEASLTSVLPRFRGLQAALGLDGEEVEATLSEPPPLTEIGIQELDRVAMATLLCTDLPALATLRIEALDRVDLVHELLGRFGAVRRLAVGRGDLATWHESLQGRGLSRVDVRVRGWVLSLGGERLDHLDAWPVPEISEDLVEPLEHALRALPIRALGYIHVRGGQTPRRERLVALRSAARGTPMLLPASWRRVLRGDP